MQGLNPSIHLGCDDNGVYWLLDIQSIKTIYARDVMFDEENFPTLKSGFLNSSGEYAESDYKTEPHHTQKQNQLTSADCIASYL